MIKTEKLIKILQECLENGFEEVDSIECDGFINVPNPPYYIYCLGWKHADDEMEEDEDYGE